MMAAASIHLYEINSRGLLTCTKPRRTSYATGSACLGLRGHVGGERGVRTFVQNLWIPAGNPKMAQGLALGFSGVVFAFACFFLAHSCCEKTAIFSLVVDAFLAVVRF